MTDDTTAATTPGRLRLFLLVFLPLFAPFGLFIWSPFVALALLGAVVVVVRQIPGGALVEHAAAVL